MTDQPTTLEGSAITGRGRSLNPFIILDDATGFIEFATYVFDAIEVEEARTPTPEGKLIHAELHIGDSLLMLSDRQGGWPAHPGMLQIWVSDAQSAVDRAGERNAQLVTPPTPFYGSLNLARLQDPWGNLWWLYEPLQGNRIQSLRGRAATTPSSGRSTSTCDPCEVTL